MILNHTHVYYAAVDFDLLDAGNVVYHPNYLILCERARNQALRDAGYAFNVMWSKGTALAVLECNAKYLRAIELNQELAIFTQTIEATGTTVRVRQLICQRNPLLTDGEEPGYKAKVIEPSQKDIHFQVEFLLGFVKLHPIKGARIPGELTAALRLPSRKPRDGE